MRALLGFGRGRANQVFRRGRPVSLELSRMVPKKHKRPQKSQLFDYISEFVQSNNKHGILWAQYAKGVLKQL